MAKTKGYRTGVDREHFEAALRSPEAHKEALTGSALGFTVSDNPDANRIAITSPVGLSATELAAAVDDGTLREKLGLPPPPPGAAIITEHGLTADAAKTAAAPGVASPVAPHWHGMSGPARTTKTAAASSMYGPALDRRPKLARDDDNYDRVLIDDLQAALLDPDKRLLARPDWRKDKNNAPALHAMARSLRGARCFNLSNDFTVLAAELSMRSPATLHNALTCARAPYDKVWIEWDEKIRTRTLAGYAGEGSSVRVGYFIERSPKSETAFFFQPAWVQNEANRKIFLAPMGFVIDTEQPLDTPNLNLLAERSWVGANESFGVDIDGDKIRAEIATARSVKLEGADKVRAEVGDGGEATIPHGFSDWTLAALRLHADEYPLLTTMLLGGWWVAIHEGDRKGGAALRDIYPHVCTTISPLWGLTFSLHAPKPDAATTDKETDFIGSGIVAIAKAWQGDLRFLLTVLSLLQSKWSAERRVRPGGGHRFIRHHHTKYLDVHECVITAPKDRIVRLYERTVAHGAKKRRHEVMGHFCERRGTGRADCVHEYGPPPVASTHPRAEDAGPPNMQVCKGCGHTRWWRHAHERGDATIGFVSKTYRVETP